DEERRSTELGSDICIRDANHVIALDLGTDSRLAFESRDGAGIRGRRAVKQLQRQLLARVDVFDDVDDAHAPAPELAEDSVARSYGFNGHGPGELRRPRQSSSVWANGGPEVQARREHVDPCPGRKGIRSTLRRSRAEPRFFRRSASGYRE